MRVFVVLLAFVASLVLTAAAVFSAVMLLAGPHGGVLPVSLHPATLILGWILVLVIPVLVARWVWRRQSRTSP